MVESRHHEAERNKSYTVFYHQGKEICQVLFHFIHGVMDLRIKALFARLDKHGIVPQVHGNIRRIPKLAMLLQDVEYIVHLITTEEHASTRTCARLQLDRPQAPSIKHLQREDLGDLCCFSQEKWCLCCRQVQLPHHSEKPTTTSAPD